MCEQYMHSMHTVHGAFVPSETWQKKKKKVKNARRVRLSRVGVENDDFRLGRKKNWRTFLGSIFAALLGFNGLRVFPSIGLIDL